MLHQQFSSTPSELMLKNLEPEIKRALDELGVKYVEYDSDRLRFEHKGYFFELKVKEVKK